MARVVKGRSPYRQGGDRYEAFRPERRDLDRARRSSSTKELLRIMALAERIGKSPLGGLAIEGAKGIANLVREKPPTLQEAAAARAAAIPTPEEQGKAAGEAQADMQPPLAVAQRPRVRHRHAARPVPQRQVHPHPRDARRGARRG